MRGLWIKVLGIVLLASTVVLGQNPASAPILKYQYQYTPVSFDFTGGGARAQGMGNAYLGVSDDISAICWNPAGMTKIEKTALGASFDRFRPRGEFNFNNMLNDNLGSSAHGDTMVMHEGTTKQSPSFSGVNSLTFISPARLRGHQFVFGIAYTRQFDDLQTTNFSFDGRASDTTLTTTGGKEGFVYDYTLNADVQSHAYPYTVNLGFGTRLYKNVDLGFTVNAYSGKLINRSAYTITAPEYQYPQSQTAVKQEYVTLLDTFKFSGVNFTVGLKGTTERLSYGLVVRSAFSLKYDGGTTSADSLYLSRKLVASQTSTAYNDFQVFKYAIPWTFGLGFAYKVQENLLVAMDGEYRPYSGKTIKVRTERNIQAGGNIEEVYATYDPKWFNSWAVRFGGEYGWKTNNRLFPFVPIRAGFGFNRVPAPSLDANGAGTSSNSRTNLSCGTGVHWSQIKLDLAYSYTFGDRSWQADIAQRVPNEVMLNNIYVLPTYSGTHHPYGVSKTRNHVVNLTFTGYF